MSKKKLIKKAKEVLTEARDEIIKQRAEIYRLKMLYYRSHILINELEAEYNIPEEEVEDLYDSIVQVK